MATALRRADSPFSIGVSCPGCGSEIELEQGFFVTTCSHCGSVLRVIAPESPPAFFAVPKIMAPQARAAVDRHLKERNLPLTSSRFVIKAVLYPYWKVDALTLKVRHETTELPVYDNDDPGSMAEPETQTKRIVALAPCTITVRAGQVDDLVPATIGLRAEYLRLRPYSSGLRPAEFEPYRIVREWADAVRQTGTTVRDLAIFAGGGHAGNRTDLMCARASIVFLPYFILESYGDRTRRAIVDAVSGRVAGSDEHSPDEIASESPTQAPSISLGQLGMELHRCATCGEPLPSEPSYVYVCRNCQRLTTLGACAGATITCGDHSSIDLLVPFWRLAKSTSPSPILIPAFRIANAEAGYRLTRRMTSAAPRLKTDAVLSGSRHMAPVNIDPSEAMVLADIAAFRIALERDENAVFKPTVGAQEVSLVYIPFRADEYFWVDTVLGAVTFERALLRRPGSESAL